MGVREEIEELKVQIRRCVDSGHKAQLMGLLKQAYGLCQSLKEELKTCSEEDRQGLKGLLKEFREMLEQESSRLAKRSGMTGTQLMQFNENPSNFSQEQWKVMQEIRGLFHRESKEIKQVITSQKKKVTPGVGLEVREKRKAGPKRSAAKRAKIVTKSKWMKS